MSGAKKWLHVLAAFAAMLILCLSVLIIVRNTYFSFRNLKGDSIKAEVSSDSSNVPDAAADASDVNGPDEKDYAAGTAGLPTGDVNMDGIISASDAASILYEVSLYGSGFAGEFNDAQLEAADVNKDGQVNAQDAAIILAYSAEDGAGGKKISIEEFAAALS